MVETGFGDTNRMAAKSVLGSHQVMAFIATTSVDRAKGFYRDMLGLQLVREELPFAVVFDAHGTTLRVTVVKEIEAQRAFGVAKRLSHDFGDFFFLQPSGSRASLVQIAIHPDKCFARGITAGWREAVPRKAAVQMPSEEQGLTGRLPVRQTAAGEAHWKNGDRERRKVSEKNVEPRMG